MDRIKQLKHESSVLQQYGKVCVGHESRKAHVEAMIAKGLLSSRKVYGWRLTFIYYCKKLWGSVVQSDRAHSS